MYGPSLGAFTSNLKSLASTVLKLSAFNAQTGLIDRSAAHRHADRQTASDDNIISAIHCVHMAQIIN